MIYLNCTEYPLHVKIIGRSERVDGKSLNESLVIPFEITYNKKKYYVYKALILLFGLFWLGTFSAELINKINEINAKNVGKNLNPMQKEYQDKRKIEFGIPIGLVLLIVLMLFFNLYDIGPGIIHYVCILLSIIFFLYSVVVHFSGGDSGKMGLMGNISYFLMLILTLVYRIYFENENKLFNFMVVIAKDSPINIDYCNRVLGKYTMYLQEKEKLDEKQMTDALYDLTKFKDWFKKNLRSLKSSKTANVQFLNRMNKELES